MSPMLAELIGTAILVLLGNGVVCNVVLAKTKGHEGGWIVITAGWGIAVFCGAAFAGQYSGAHLNPAITVAQAVKGSMEWSTAVTYFVGQLVGAILGACLVFIFYRSHFDAEQNADNKLACFSTSPAIPGHGQAFVCEVIATFVLVFALLYFQSPQIESASGTEAASVGMNLGLGALDFLPVALLVFGIGLSLGGTTGYAINPIRDLGPRIAHQFLPIPGKRDSNWGYAWVPIAGPIVGAIIAVLAFQLLGNPS